MKKVTMMAMSLGLLLSIGDALAEKLNSPTKKLEMNFELKEAGEPTYSLKMADGTVITKTSKMGFEMKDSKLSFDKNFEVIKTNTSSFDETWTPVWGEVKKIRNNYNELEVQLRKKDTDKLLTIRFRLYDDGLGSVITFQLEWSLKTCLAESCLRAVCRVSLVK